jgi:hypothetical protein
MNMKMAYQQCEESGCQRQGECMVRDKNDYFIVVCKVCADRRKQPVKGGQGKLL